MKRLAIAVLSIFILGPSPVWSQNLREAVETNDYERVKTLLESGANPNTSYENRITPIYLSSSPKVVGLLLAHGAKLDMRDAAGVQTPIENAANLKRRITWYGGRSGTWFIWGEGTALHYAVDEGNYESVKILIEAGLDPNAADDKGQSPLHITLQSERFASTYPNSDTFRYLKIVEYLLANEASLTFRDHKGRTPEDLAEQLRAHRKYIKRYAIQVPIDRLQGNVPDATTARPSEAIVAGLTGR